MIDERQIDEMSYVFFEDILEELGHKLTYDAVVNYAGNSFCEKSWDMIMEHHPIYLNQEKAQHTGLQGVANLFNSANVRVIKPGNK